MTLIVAALLAAASAATWLDVPFVRQPKDGCGSASIWMLMQYWQAPQIDVLQDIHRSVFSEKAGGVYATDMQRYLTAHGFDVFAFSGHWADLQDNLEKGRPLIVSLEGNSLRVMVSRVDKGSSEQGWGVKLVVHVLVIDEPAAS